MKKEAYERTLLNVTLFDKSDVIATSDEGSNPNPGGSGGNNAPALTKSTYELPIGF